MSFSHKDFLTGIFYFLNLLQFLIDESDIFKYRIPLFIFELLPETASTCFISPEILQEQ